MGFIRYLSRRISCSLPARTLTATRTFQPDELEKTKLSLLVELERNEDYKKELAKVKATLKCPLSGPGPPKHLLAKQKIWQFKKKVTMATIRRHIEPETIKNNLKFITEN
ncbi:hypothetical protein HAX54_018671, partial [Datura stramonium]|nr:hypothetical protein [Datura stramonium]